jgi:ribonuclease HI
METPTPKKLISIYCDGSSTGNSKGPVGWGWLVVDWELGEILTAGSAGGPVGTNNIAELQAAIHGLRAVIDAGLHLTANIEVVSDSTYCLGLASGEYQPNTNKDIVSILRKLFLEANATPKWVRGHSGDAFNDKVDELAKAGRDKYHTGDTKKKRRSRKREERRRKRALVKEYKRRVYGYKPREGRH